MNGDSLALLLGLSSALLLAFNNFLIKRAGDIFAGRATLSLSSALIMLPFAFVVPLPGPATWAALAWSIPAHLIYQFSLVRAMHRGDLSLVFPVMRGLAPLLTGIFALIFLNEGLSTVSWIGLSLTVIAVISFGVPEHLEGRRLWPDSQAMFFAGVTAVAISLYSVADAHGMRVTPDPFSYIVWLFLLDAIGLPTALIASRGVPRAVQDMHACSGHAVTAGILSILSFGAYLLAIRIIPAAQASALRETSVVIAALLGWLFLKEAMGPRRVVAAGAVVVGLILMRSGAG